MPVGFSSAARNLFLLGSTGAQVVSNFFKRIDQSTGTDGVYLPDEIRFNALDEKFLLAGSASDSNLKDFGWFEKRTTGGTSDWDVRVEATQGGINTTLRAMELDSNNNLIVVGKTGDIPWIAKYDNNGIIDWQSTTNSADVEYTGITSDSNGNYYACGSTPINGEATAFVEKFDASGNPGWGKAAFMLGRDVVLNKVAANNRGEVVAVGYLEDDSSDKGYIVKIDTTTGEVLWDRTLDDNSTDPVVCNDVFIDDNDQIYVVGNVGDKGYIVKYTAEGNIIWQKFSANTLDTITYKNVKSDSETEQTIVFGTYDNISSEAGILTKYSKNGDLVWRRILYSSFNFTDTFSNVNLDADPSFYYILFTDEEINEPAATPLSYTFGKVSSSGNGLGNFEYFDGSGETIYYEILGTGDEIGRLSDGSVRQDSSDLITYPFSANKLLFDDLATQVSNKKRQMDSPDSFEYSGSPAIRPADFQELNLLGDTGITDAIVYSTEWSPSLSNGDSAFDGNLSSFAGILGGTTGPFTYTFANPSAINSARMFVTFGASSGQVGGATNIFLVNGIDVTQKAKDANLYAPSSGWIDVTTEAGSNWNTFQFRTISGVTNAGISAIEVNGKILIDSSVDKWLDQSGKGNDGVVNGATWNASGYWEFDGDDDYIDLGTQPVDSDLNMSSPSGGGLAVEWWGYYNGTGDSFQRIVDRSNAGGALNGWAIYTGSVGSSTDIRLSTNGESVVITSSQQMVANVWQHWCITWDQFSGDWAWYLNGQQTNNGNSTWNIPAVETGMRIGTWNHSTGREYSGRIGEFRIYPRALTAAQVFQNYNATKSKYINEAPDIAPKIGPGIVYDSNLLLNYDFGNRATYDQKAVNLIVNSNNPSQWVGQQNYTITQGFSDPFGGTTASKVINNNPSNNFIYQPIGAVMSYYPAGTTMCVSFWIKSVDGSTGTWGVNMYNGTSHSRRTVPITGEWQRVSFTFSSVSGFGNIYWNDNRDSLADTNEAYIYGFQLNPSGTPGTYVKTTSSIIAPPTIVNNLSSTFHTGTINGATFNSAGYFEFDGTNDIIDIPDSADFTITETTLFCWVNASILNDASSDLTTGILSSYDTSGAQYYGIRIDKNQASNKAFYYYDDNGSFGFKAIRSTTTILENQWYHLCMTWKSGQFHRGYLNGVLEVEETNVATTTLNPNDGFYIGDDFANRTGFYNGKVGEVQIYNRALGAAEVLQNFNATRSKYGV